MPAPWKLSLLAAPWLGVALVNAGLDKPQDHPALNSISTRYWIADASDAKGYEASSNEDLANLIAPRQEDVPHPATTTAGPMDPGPQEPQNPIQNPIDTTKKPEEPAPSTQQPETPIQSPVTQTAKPKDPEITPKEPENPIQNPPTTTEKPQEPVPRPQDPESPATTTEEPGGPVIVPPIPPIPQDPKDPKDPDDPKPDDPKDPDDPKPDDPKDPDDPKPDDPKPDDPKDPDDPDGPKDPEDPKEPDDDCEKKEPTPCTKTVSFYSESQTYTSTVYVTCPPIVDCPAREASTITTSIIPEVSVLWADLVPEEGVIPDALEEVDVESQQDLQQLFDDENISINDALHPDVSCEINQDDKDIPRNCFMSIFSKFCSEVDGDVSKQLTKNLTGADADKNSQQKRASLEKRRRLMQKRAEACDGWMFEYNWSGASGDCNLSCGDSMDAFGDECLDAGHSFKHGTIDVGCGTYTYSAIPSSTPTSASMPDCDANKGSDMPWNIFSGDKFSLTGDFCRELAKGDGKSGLSWSVDGKGQVINNKRRRAPPVNQNDYGDYKVKLEWEPKDGTDTKGCTSFDACTEAYSSAAKGPCGHAGGTQSFMTPEGSYDRGCGTFKWSIESPEKKGSDENYVPLNGPQEQFCHSESNFPGHKDTRREDMINLANYACGAAPQVFTKDTSRWQKKYTEGKSDYFFSIEWKGGCKTDVEKQNIQKLDGKTAYPSCWHMMYENWEKCDNNGVGGNRQAGCLEYTFSPHMVE